MTLLNWIPAKDNRWLSERELPVKDYFDKLKDIRWCSTAKTKQQLWESYNPTSGAKGLHGQQGSGAVTELGLNDFYTRFVILPKVEEVIYLDLRGLNHCSFSFPHTLTN